MEGDEGDERRRRRDSRGRDSSRDVSVARSFPSYLRPGALDSFCRFAFALTPEAKGRILQGEANLQKRHEMRASHARAARAGLFAHDAPFGSPDAPFLEIVVDRERLLEDALDALSTRPSADVKKPLRVRFVSDGVAEEGIDEGGVTKEFFQLLVREMFDVDDEDANAASVRRRRRRRERRERVRRRRRERRGKKSKSRMFAYDEESRVHWFDPAAPTDDASLARLNLFGAALGLAIYNGVVLDVALPPSRFAVWRTNDTSRRWKISANSPRA